MRAVMVPTIIMLVKFGEMQTIVGTHHIIKIYGDDYEISTIMIEIEQNKIDNDHVQTDIIYQVQMIGVTYIVYGIILY